MIVFAFGSVDTNDINTGGGSAPLIERSSDQSEDGAAKTPSASSSGFSFGKRVVTKAHYDQLQNGMSYRDAVTIIGTEGDEMSRNRIEGVPGVMSSVETVMYMWQNGDGTNMNAMFQNDKLMQKSQFGLK